MSDNPRPDLSDWPLDPEVIYLNHGATLPLPATTSMSASVLYEALWRKHRIEASVFEWPASGRPMLRVCAQIYNDLRQYQQLADAVRAELG